MNLQALRDSVNRKDYQVCEPLTADEMEALKASVAANGITVPVAVDEEFRIIDGYHRMEVFFALVDAGGDVPMPQVEVLAGLTEQAKWDEAYRRNYQRRQMTPAQKAAKAVDLYRKGLSNEQIAATIGVSPRSAEGYTAEERKEQKRQRDQRIRQLAKEGKSQRGIARALDIDEKTVRLLLGAEESQDCDFSAPDENDSGTETTSAEDDPAVPAQTDEDDQEERWDACAVCRHNISVKVDGEYRNICAATQTNLDTYIEIDDTGYPPCYDTDTDTLAQFDLPEMQDTVAWDDVKDELLADKPERPKSLAAANHAISDDPDYDGDEWYTPLEFIAAARCVLGDIDLDPASSDEAQTVVQATRYATKEDDSLRPDYPWTGRVWMNPPYSMPLIRQFVTRIIDEYDAGNVTEAIVLTNNSSDTQWFHALLSRFPACFTRGRIYFWRKEPDNNFSTRQGQTLFYLGPNRDAFAREFAGIGLVVERTHAQPQI